jgi:hypothetical protein
MAEAVAAGDRPQVAKLQKLLRSARLFTLDGREEWQPRAQTNLAVLLPSIEEDAVEVFVLYGGGYGGQRRVGLWDEDPEPVAVDLRELAKRAAAGDEANIVARWLGANPSAPTVPLPVGKEGWEEAADAVLGLVEAVLSGAVDAPERFAEEV